MHHLSTTASVLEAGCAVHSHPAAVADSQTAVAGNQTAVADNCQLQTVADSCQL